MKIGYETFGPPTKGLPQKSIGHFFSTFSSMMGSKCFLMSSPKWKVRKVLVRWSFLNCLLAFFRIRVFFVGKKNVVFVSEASLFVYILFKFSTLSGINKKCLNTRLAPISKTSPNTWKKNNISLVKLVNRTGIKKKQVCVLMQQVTKKQFCLVYKQSRTTSGNFFSFVQIHSLKQFEGNSETNNLNKAK